MFLPEKIYEALPATYVMVGSSLVLGAAYIGIDQSLMVGYLAVGLSCILAGAMVAGIRRRERSKEPGIQS
jgi:hypothetical protein